MGYSWLLVLLAGLNSTLGNILLKKSQLKYSFFQSLLSIEFISTPFDTEAVDMLDPLMRFYKISSSDITNFPLLKKI